MQALEYHQLLLELLTQETPCVSVTLVDVIGSAPQTVGARMLVTAAGLYAGTVGGGKIEMRCLALAQELLAQSEGPSTRYVEWNLQTEIGMTCGGVVRLYFELHSPTRWQIAVFGAGHVAQALIPLLSSLRCSLRCYDARPEWIAKLPPAPVLQAEAVADPAEQVARLPRSTFILSMTMGHAYDVPILEQVFRRRAEDPEAFPFVGVIGSPAKAGAIRRDLRKRGISDEALTHLRCPVGLPLGNNEPAEIAVSITAQLLQERDALLHLHDKWEQPAYRRTRKDTP